MADVTDYRYGAMRAEVGFTYSHPSDATQAIIYNILKNDSTVSALADKILDGLPPNLERSKGFPIIIVRPPALTPAVKFTMGPNPKYRITVEVPIECYSRIEKNARRMADAVGNALRANTAETKSFRLYNYSWRTARGILEQPDGRHIHTMTVFATYETVD